MLILCSYTLLFGLGRGVTCTCTWICKHMHMKIETYAHAHTQVEETPEARMQHYLMYFSFLIKIALSKIALALLKILCLWVNGEGWGQQHELTPRWKGLALAHLSIETRKSKHGFRETDLTEARYRKLLFFAIIHRTGCIHLDGRRDQRGMHRCVLASPPFFFFFIPLAPYLWSCDLSTWDVARDSDRECREAKVHDMPPCQITTLCRYRQRRHRRGFQVFRSRCLVHEFFRQALQFVQNLCLQI